MTDPPTLAPLIEMDEAKFQLVVEMYGDEADGLPSELMVHDLLCEVLAQRRARVQEADSVRRQAFDEAIGAIRIAYVEEFNAWLVSPRDVVGRLERLRDQPAEDKATKQEMSDGR